MLGKRPTIPVAVRNRLEQARVARLATVDAAGAPHLVPVCFVYDGKAFYTAVDRKPKTVPADRLARLRNIRTLPRVALLIDHYAEDWTRLWYVLVRGKARVLGRTARQERARALRQLRAKYRQYRQGMLTAEAPVIRIRPERITSWGNLEVPASSRRVTARQRRLPRGARRPASPPRRAAV
jgi:coenzyme F420-0:L-glutamate ligase / coenzyme F420-1:gamma-L-glutamate ligase